MRSAIYSFTQAFGVLLIFAAGFGYGTMQSQLSPRYESQPIWSGLLVVITGWIMLKLDLRKDEDGTN